MRCNRRRVMNGDTVEYGQEHPEWAEKIIEKFSKEN